MTNMHNKIVTWFTASLGNTTCGLLWWVLVCLKFCARAVKTIVNLAMTQRTGAIHKMFFSLLPQLPMWYTQWYLSVQPFIFKATPSRQSIAITVPKAEHTCTLSVCAIWLYIMGAFLPLVILAGCLQSGLPFQLIRPSQFLSFPPGTAQPPARLIGSFVPSCFAEQRQNKRKCCSGTIVSTLVSKDKRKWHMNALLDR